MVKGVLYKMHVMYAYVFYIRKKLYHIVFYRIGSIIPVEYTMFVCKNMYMQVCLCVCLPTIYNQGFRYDNQHNMCMFQVVLSERVFTFLNRNAQHLENTGITFVKLFPCILKRESSIFTIVGPGWPSQMHQIS